MIACTTSREQTKLFYCNIPFQYSTNTFFPILVFNFHFSDSRIQSNAFQQTQKLFRRNFSNVALIYSNFKTAF